VVEIPPEKPGEQPKLKRKFGGCKLHERPGAYHLAIYCAYGVTKATAMDLELNTTFQQHMEMSNSPTDEDIRMPRSMSYAINKMKDTLIIDKTTKRATSGCMWKAGEPVLVNNRPYAEKRHYALEKSKVLRDPDLRKQFNQIILDHLRDGYVRKVPKEEQRAKVAYYLPIFAVVRMDKSSSKVRIVIDARARYLGKSLNDAIETNFPNEMVRLVRVLLRFRKEAVAFSADIKQMFLQIRLAEEDRKFHRFLFRESNDQPLEEYEFCVHAFGNAASPAIAMHAIREAGRILLEEEPDNVALKRATELVNESTLVDDNMD
jgi:hypothetical protein